MQGTSLRGNSQATVANAGSPGRARSSRKTIAQGVPGDFGVPVLASRAFVFFGTQGSGCVVHPAFPAPSIFEGHRIARLGRKSRRGDAVSCLVGIARSEAAKQSIGPQVDRWIASLRSQ